MSVESNRKLVLRFFDEVCNGRRPEVAEQIFTPDYVYRDPQVPNVKGPQAMAAVVKTYQDGVEGFWRVDEVAGGEDNRVAVRWTGMGKYTGSMPGISVPPNGNAVEVSALSLFRIDGDK